MRLLQTAGVNNNTRILHAAVAEDNQMVKLVIAAPDYAVASSGIVWLSSPDVSSCWSTWHPFDYIAVPWPATAILGTTGQSPSSKQSVANAGFGATEPQTAMLINMKAAGNWTKAFIAQLAEQGTNVCAKVQGPYADIGSPVIGHGNAGYGQTSVAAAGIKKNSSGQELGGSVIVAGEQHIIWAALWGQHEHIGS
jgi:hypothetical protein